MIEKVNPKHPDKIADRIAGAILDLSYKKQENPRVAVEVLIGHGSLMIINETSVKYNETISSPSTTVPPVVTSNTLFVCAVVPTIVENVKSPVNVPPVNGK